MLAYYLVGVPLAYFLALGAPDLAIRGLLLGYYTAIFLQFMSYVCILGRADWQQIADDTKDRLRDEATTLKWMQSPENTVDETFVELECDRTYGHYVRSQ